MKLCIVLFGINIEALIRYFGLMRSLDIKFLDFTLTLSIVIEHIKACLSIVASIPSVCLSWVDIIADKGERSSVYVWFTIDHDSSVGVSVSVGVGVSSSRGAWSVLLHMKCLCQTDENQDNQDDGFVHNFNK